MCLPTIHWDDNKISEDWPKRWSLPVFSTDQYQFQIQDENLLNESVKLEAAIKYQEDDLVNCRILVEQLPENDAAVIINTACIDYKVNMNRIKEQELEGCFQEGNYEEALKKFNEATEFSGYQVETFFKDMIYDLKKL